MQKCTLTVFLKDWFSPAAMENQKMMEAKGKGNAKQFQFQFQLQSFSEFETQVLFHHGFQVQGANIVDTSSFWKVVLLRYAAFYGQASIEYNQQAYDDTILKLAGLDKERALKFYSIVGKLNLDKMEIALINALIIFTKQPGSNAELGLQMGQQAEVYTEVLTGYEYNKCGARAGVKLGLILSLLSKLASLVKIENLQPSPNNPFTPGSA